MPELAQRWDYEKVLSRRSPLRLLCWLFALLKAGDFGDLAADPSTAPMPGVAAYEQGMRHLAQARVVRPPDPAEMAQAQRYFKIGAELGHPVSMFNYAVGLSQPAGTGAANLTEAARWYERAATNGVPEAAYNRGLLLMGIGAGGDAAAAARWFEKAATNGLASAQLALGRRWGEGRGAAADYAQAARWYRAAAEQGNSEALFAWSALIRARRVAAGPDMDPDAMLRRAAEGGVAEAQELLAMALATNAVAEVQAEVFRWFLSAAEQGRPLAQWEAGRRLVEGLATKTNTVVGAAWMLVAADDLSPDARQELRNLERMLPAGTWELVRNQALVLRQAVVERRQQEGGLVAYPNTTGEAATGLAKRPGSSGGRARRLSEVRPRTAEDRPGLPPEDYREALTQAAYQRFQQLVNEALKGGVRSDEVGRGHLVLTFRLHSDGTLSEFQVKPGGTGGDFADLVLVAFAGISPFKAWSPEVRKLVGAEYVDLVQTFSTEPVPK